MDNQSEELELRDVNGNLFAVVKPAAWPNLQAYLASVQDEYDRILGADAPQVVAEEPVEDDNSSSHD